jgi:hypothetical protein
MKKRINTLTLIIFILQLGFSQNNCLDFDGTDDYVDCGDNVALQVAQGTIEGWFKTNSTSVQFVAGIPYDDGSIWDPPFVGLHIGTSNNTCRFWLNVNGINREFSGGTVNLNQWYHIALTYDGNNALGYLNGTIVANNLNQFGNILYSGSPSFQIGNRSLQAQGEFFDGEIDDIRIWNVARTQTEIQNNMNTELAGTESGLLSYWKFDNTNSSCDVKDCNSNENHGTRIGPIGSNNLPQFSSEVPSLIDVACGASTSCDCPTSTTFTEVVDNNWSSVENWSGGCVPTSPLSENAIINGNCNMQFSGGFTFGPSGSLTISSGFTLTITEF